MKTDQLIQQCTEIYEAQGYHAVIDFCNTLNLKYKYCKGCEAFIPQKNNTCLICGQNVRTPMTKLLSLAKALNFETKNEYFSYMVISHINGQFTQCRELFHNMSKKDRNAFIQHLHSLSDNSHYQSAYTFYLTLI